MPAAHQTVGNIGMFYTCYRLSLLGWNVLPTARNARGIDILAYSQDATRTFTVQVKSLSKSSPVPLGKKLDHLFADFVVICCNVVRDRPECFILTPAEVKQVVHRGVKNGQVSYWLQPKKYDRDEFRERWDRIGTGEALSDEQPTLPQRIVNSSPLRLVGNGGPAGASSVLPSLPEPMAKAVAFRQALVQMLIEAEQRGLPQVEISAGQLHRRVGGYPGPNHRMPSCCDAMRASMRVGDAVVAEPPKGRGASLTIRYRLPRNY